MYQNNHTPLTNNKTNLTGHLLKIYFDFCGFKFVCLIKKPRNKRGLFYQNLTVHLIWTLTAATSLWS